MKFTLILATLGRSDEVRRMLESLKRQSYQDFEVVLIDQNSDNRVFKLYKEYCDSFQINYIRTQEKGLSHARNLAIQYGKLNDIVGFPDDDCWYSRDTLKQVNNFFLQSDSDIVSGQPVDSNGIPLVRSFLKNDTMVNLDNVWNAGISFTIFFKRQVIEKVGAFDEMLGVGSGTVYGSGEETDYLIRALKRNFKMRYVSKLIISHPRKTAAGNKNDLSRALLYGGGMGYVLKKHHYDKKSQLLCMIRPLGGSVLAFMKLDFYLAKYRMNTLRGRIRGLRAKI
ncbi:MAG TPA: glycosyltransferase family 2 protein [Veillonellaceae bacterium]|jgi:glycosyltransferase involved in cell wall biosynthesis|nr:glycosyltransferase family 2 protein [Veillonellaceae bacterium]